MNKKNKRDLFRKSWKRQFVRNIGKWKQMNRDISVSTVLDKRPWTTNGQNIINVLNGL